MPAQKKHPSTRARRNKTAGARTLAAVSAAGIPDKPDWVDWTPAAVAYWNDMWASEMSSEWLESDYHNVVMCTSAYNDFVTGESAKDRKDAMAELRLQRKDLGLSPMARRSLEWAVESAEQAKERGAVRRSTSSSSKQPKRGEDPRSVLQAVN
ncbi:hypothetical protein [Curtobacterium sp. MCBA15_004]|uniref:phage terminase small subunit n=1 Tax=Curtobacterium sp. MCBA15_004 TaxID=1898733 RepID=UPI0008DEA8C6|nr:hypothetical protein [Curtobacterium sp. MCBA15_004]WIA95813.1 hypothetical protein QOL16_11905 [Curtobacterium sp. MCBA15_004]